MLQLSLIQHERPIYLNCYIAFKSLMTINHFDITIAIVGYIESLQLFEFHKLTYLHCQIGLNIESYVIA